MISALSAGWGPSIVGEKLPELNSKRKPKPNDKTLASVLRRKGLSHGLALPNIAL